MGIFKVFIKGKNLATDCVLDLKFKVSGQLFVPITNQNASLHIGRSHSMMLIVIEIHVCVCNLEGDVKDALFGVEQY